MRTPTVLLVLLTCASCGSEQGAADSGLDATSADASGDSPASDAASDASDASVADAVADAGSIVLEGGGPFLCLGCVCDGVDHFCAHYSGGAAPLLPDAGLGFGDAGVCDPDAGQPYCTAIAPACLPNPSCDCVLANMPTCTCALDPSGNGLVITCVFP